MAGIDPQEFGRLEAEVAALRRDNDRLLTELGKIGTRLGSIEEKLSEARGGWKVLMAVSGASAGLGGVLTAAVQHFMGRGGS